MLIYPSLSNIMLSLLPPNASSTLGDGAITVKEHGRLERVTLALELRGKEYEATGTFETVTARQDFIIGLRLLSTQFWDFFHNL
jgi:hypothetical protein